MRCADEFPRLHSWYKTSPLEFVQEVYSLKLEQFGKTCIYLILRLAGGISMDESFLAHLSKGELLAGGRMGNVNAGRLGSAVSCFLFGGAPTGIP